LEITSQKINNAYNYAYAHINAFFLYSWIRIGFISQKNKPILVQQRFSKQTKFYIYKANSSPEKVTMKKLAPFVLTITLIAMLCGCSPANNPDTTPPSNPIETETEQPTVLPPTETPTLKPTVEPLDAEFLKSVQERKQAILSSESEVEYSGTAYYVSNLGDDKNDGLTPETAWATITKVNQAPLQSGDAVFFERGGLWRGKVLFCQQGVVYSAYGEGEKPTITLSPEDGTGAEKWSLFYEGPDGEKIWTYYKDMEDLGTIFFDQNTRWADKVPAKWVNGEYVNKRNEPFDVTTDLKTDLSFFSEASSDLPKTGTVFLWEKSSPGNWGPLYLRSDAGNPGEIFSSMEFASVGYTGSNSSNAIVRLADNSVIDNLRLIYGGNSGVGGAVKNATIQNCEIGWVGGGVLMYDDNVLFSTGDGSVTVAGDGLAVGGIGATIRNNYVHDSFMDGITIEDASLQTISDLTLQGNLFENNHVGIQLVYYNNDENAAIFYHNIQITDNFVVSSGYGWGTEQPNMRRDAGGQYSTSLSLSDFQNPNDGIYITNNVFYDARDIQIYGRMPEKYMPTLMDNTFYLRHMDSDFSIWSENCDWYKANQAAEFLQTIFGNESNSIIVLNSH
jgi:hypothetical protein